MFKKLSTQFKYIFVSDHEMTVCRPRSIRMHRCAFIYVGKDRISSNTDAWIISILSRV